jgi:hypothetical protein
MTQFSVLQKVLGAEGLVAGNPPGVEPHYSDATWASACKPIKKKDMKEWKKMLTDPSKTFIWYAPLVPLVRHHHIHMLLLLFAGAIS